MNLELQKQPQQCENSSQGLCRLFSAFCVLIVSTAPTSCADDPALGNALLSAIVAVGNASTQSSSRSASGYKLPTYTPSTQTTPYIPRSTYNPDVGIWTGSGSTNTSSDRHDRPDGGDGTSPLPGGHPDIHVN